MVGKDLRDPPDFIKAAFIDKEIPKSAPRNYTNKKNGTKEGEAASIASTRDLMEKFERLEIITTRQKDRLLGYCDILQRAHDNDPDEFSWSKSNLDLLFQRQQPSTGASNNSPAGDEEVQMGSSNQQSLQSPLGDGSAHRAVLCCAVITVMCCAVLCCFLSCGVALCCTCVVVSCRVVCCRVTTSDLVRLRRRIQCCWA